MSGLDRTRTLRLQRVSARASVMGGVEASLACGSAALERRLSSVKSSRSSAALPQARGSRSENGQIPTREKGLPAGEWAGCEVPGVTDRLLRGTRPESGGARSAGRETGDADQEIGATFQCANSVLA